MITAPQVVSRFVKHWARANVEVDEQFLPSDARSRGGFVIEPARTSTWGNRRNIGKKPVRLEFPRYDVVEDPTLWLC